MTADLSVFLLMLELLGTFAFALNGALTAIRSVSIDVVGVITLGMITAVGGGIIRDVLMGATPPATFVDWRYLAVATAGSLLVFVFGHRLSRLRIGIEVMDAAGLSLFAVTGAGKALELGADWPQAIILGTITAVGGGTMRDVLIRKLPGVLSTGLYAVPALIAAATVGIAAAAGADGVVITISAAAVCFAIRMLALRFRLHAPRPLGSGRNDVVDRPRQS